MSAKSKNFNLSDLLGLVALLFVFQAFRSFLKDDSSKIVSAQGATVLEDKQLMEKVSAAIEHSKKSGEKGVREEVVVNLD